MAITNLIKINGVDVPAVKKYVVGINKLWREANRNMKGELKSTFVGNFVKIELEIGHTTQAQMTTLRGMLDNSFMTVLWFDEKTDTLKSGTFYPSDFSYGLYRKDVALYEPFMVSIIATKKLT
jgi:hypothetical protein